MDNGTVWGHGAYLGPDFSAQYPLLALDLADRIARQRFAHPYAELSAEARPL
jgi:nitric oxide reductase subunit B